MNEKWNKGALLKIEHSYWANKQIYAMLENETLDSKAWIVFAHILSATHNWVSRLQKQESRWPIWPRFTQKEQAQLLIEDNQSDLVLLSQNLDLDMAISYQNSKGEQFGMEVWEIAEHIFLHEHFHRGQINLEARESGLAPAPIDLIYFLRTKK